MKNRYKMSNKKAQVYFYQERTLQGTITREGHDRVPRRYGAQLVLDEVILCEVGYEETGGIISADAMATEVGQLIGRQIRRRRISDYQVKMYQRAGNAECMHKNELSYGVVALAHLKKGFLAGLKTPDFKFIYPR